MKKIMQHLFDLGIKKIDVVFYGLVVFFCFIAFQQDDLFITIITSLAYLKGHFFDFYEFNYQQFSGSDYFPTIYIVFAVWNIPLKLFTLVTSDISLTTWRYGLDNWTFLWSKALLAACFFFTSHIIGKIYRIVDINNKEQSITPAIIFATSPIAIFSTFIMGQYDVIGLLLSMIGFYYYLQKKLFQFALVFSIAISCKFFPLVIFIPLLLLSEKRILHLIKYSLVAASISLIEIIVYWHSHAFRDHTLFGTGVAGSKLKELPVFKLTELTQGPYLVILFSLICFYAYLKAPHHLLERFKMGVFIALASFSVLFSTIWWHPQWFIYLTPFFALSTVFFKQKEKFYFIDTLGACAFFLIVIWTWGNNLDVSMMGNGILHDFFTAPLPSMARLIPPAKVHSVVKAFFLIYLFSPLFILSFQAPVQSCLANKTVNQYFRARFIIGLGCFLVPAVFCALAAKYLPSGVINQIDPQYYKKVIVLPLVRGGEES